MFSDSADLLWFVLPSEATDLLSGKQKLPLREQYVFKPADFAPLSKGMVSLHNMLRTCLYRMKTNPESYFLYAYNSFLFCYYLLAV